MNALFHSLPLDRDKPFVALILQLGAIKHCIRRHRNNIKTKNKIKTARLKLKLWKTMWNY